MNAKALISGALVALALTACSGSGSESSLEDDFAAGIAQLGGTRDYPKLHAQVTRTLASLRGDEVSGAGERRAKGLALRGFAWVRRGFESRIAFVQNDSGNVEAATRDAKRADRSLRHGSALLRTAGGILGVDVAVLDEL